MSLFLDQDLTFEKNAAIARLGENPDDWGPKIVSELHKQLPFISQYESRLEMKELLPEQGYGLGFIDVRNRTMKTPVDEVKGEPVKHARIPVIVKDFELQPFDLFMRDKQALPLTEERFTEAMFRPDIFDSAQKPPPGGGALTSNLYPPFQVRDLHSQVSGHGSASMERTASAQPSFLMDAIGHTLSETDMDRLIETVKSDPSIASAFQKNAAVASVMRMVGLAKVAGQRASSGDLLDDIQRQLIPNVVQITKLGSGNVLFKWAQGEAFEPQQMEVPPAEAMEMAGPEVQELQPGESMTVSPQQEAKEVPLQEEPEPVVSFGEYKVIRQADGREVMGWVIPNLLQFTLQPSDLSLFTNGSEFCVAPGILGTPVGRGANLPEGNPSGYGVFYFEHKGKVAATVPVTVATTVKNPEGNVTFQAQDDMGQPVMLTVAPGIANIAAIGEGEFAIPDHWKFLPLDGKIEVASAGAPVTPEAPSPAPADAMAPVEAAAPPPAPTEGVNKTAMARLVPDAYTIVSDGDRTYSIRGRAFEKVASRVSMVGRDDAEFMLVCAGMHPKTAMKKLAEAKGSLEGQSHFVAPLHTIVPWKEKVAQSYRSAHELIQSLPNLKRNLWKEAAVVEDADTVDKMLALGFLTPENMKIFVDYLPLLEEAVRKLADLVFASRVGMNEVPEGAAQRAMLSMEEVISGLKKLAH